MDKEYLELLKKVDKIEKEYGSVKNFAILSTCKEVKHKLRIGRSADLEGVYEDLSDLEYADLIDFQNLEGEYGERF